MDGADGGDHHEVPVVAVEEAGLCLDDEGIEKAAADRSEDVDAAVFARGAPEVLISGDKENGFRKEVQPESLPALGDGETRGLPRILSFKEGVSGRERALGVCLTGRGDSCGG